MRAVLERIAAWLRGRDHGYRSHVATEHDDHLRLQEAFDECAGRWVAIDRRTGRVVDVADSPYELSARIKSNRVTGVDILRAPEHSEPEVVGFG